LTIRFVYHSYENISYKMITIKSLAGISYDSLFEAFRDAFSDYEMQLSKQELQKMLIRRGFDSQLSFGAFEKNKIVAFTFNGIGNFNNFRTAYDTGTGTLKKYRGQGLATQIFNHSILFLKKTGVSQYLLEVLQHNSKAISVYQKLGFKVSREFNYFIQKSDEIKSAKEILHPEYRILPVDLHQIISKNDFRDFVPSWQNSFEAVNRTPGAYIMMGTFFREKLIGYCIFEPESGDITQIAVQKEYRKKGVATALLQEMLAFNKNHSVKCINTETNSLSIAQFLQSFNIALKGKQFEMIKHL